MSLVLDTSFITVANSDSIIGFEKVGEGAWPVWDRYLTIEGKRAYHIGNVCETCDFFFERLEGANRSVSPSDLSNIFKEGLQNLDGLLVTQASKILPISNYRVSLLKITPRRVKLGTQNDYFASEQVELWGVDEFSNLPHYPKIEYYRGHSLPMGQGKQLFEFVIPMFPESWLRQDEVREYTERLMVEKQPTTLALSVLDVKQPAVWDGDPAITQHYCLAHYLLDGHHKTHAASELVVLYSNVGRYSLVRLPTFCLAL
jgi:hypothetical protein